MNYAKIIKQLRNKLLLSQTEFAKYFNVTYITVCRWETGNNEPSFKNKRKIIALCKENNVDYGE